MNAPAVHAPRYGTYAATKFTTAIEPDLGHAEHERAEPDDDGVERRDRRDADEVAAQRTAACAP